MKLGLVLECDTGGADELPVISASPRLEHPPPLATAASSVPNINEWGIKNHPPATLRTGFAELVQHRLPGTLQFLGKFCRWRKRFLVQIAEAALKRADRDPGRPGTIPEAIHFAHRPGFRRGQPIRAGEVQFVNAVG